jgi:hypothetical protein
MKDLIAATVRLALAAACAAQCLSCDAGEGNPAVGEIRARLERARNCTELESMLREDARQKMNAQIDALIESVDRYGANGWHSPPVFGLATGAGTNEGPKEDSASTRATDFSETNTQVEGVDEADVVKNDGKYIYLLHGNRFLELDAWPAANLSQTAAIEIEGQPTEMYVAGDSAVVFSAVDGTAIYDAAGVTPRSNYYDAVRYGVTDVASGDFAFYPTYFYAPMSKITIIALSGAEPVVSRELYFEGSYLSSRRVAEHVRTVIAGGAQARP